MAILVPSCPHYFLDEYLFLQMCTFFIFSSACPRRSWKKNFCRHNCRQPRNYPISCYLKVGVQVQVVSGSTRSASTCTSGGQNNLVKCAFCGSACACMAGVSKLQVCWRALLASLLTKSASFERKTSAAAERTRLPLWPVSACW
jgi:hypothetical protein